jgi:hypothetical protein
MHWPSASVFSSNLRPSHFPWRQALLRLVKPSPVYNVTAIARQQGARQTITADDHTLGDQSLSLLHKTDRRHLVECWGKPMQHQDPRVIYQVL